MKQSDEQENITQSWKLQGITVETQERLFCGINTVSCFSIYPSDQPEKMTSNLYTEYKYLESKVRHCKCVQQQITSVLSSKISR